MLERFHDQVKMEGSTLCNTDGDVNIGFDRIVQVSLMYLSLPKVL